MLQTMKLAFFVTLGCVLTNASNVSAQYFSGPPSLPSINTSVTPPALLGPFSGNNGPASQSLQSQYRSNFSVSSPAPSLPTMDSGGGGRLPFGINSSTSGTKPFSSYSALPTVSPYLNLFRTDAGGAVNQFNYSTLVEPQLRQQQMNQQLQLQNQQNYRRLQQIAAQPNLNPQGSKDLYPTGHQTVYNYMSHYYGPMRPHAKHQHVQPQ